LLTEVLLIRDLASDCRLPLGALFEAKRRLQTGEWKFKYLYFTEADQIFVGRNMLHLYNWMDRHIHGILVPHRLLIAPPAFLEQRNKTKEQSMSLSIRGSFERYSCCFDNGVFGRHRKHWKKIDHPAAGYFLFQQVPVIPANANFWGLEFRLCNMSLRDPKYGCAYNPVQLQS
jgi:hypothetical protein